MEERTIFLVGKLVVDLLLIHNSFRLCICVRVGGEGEGGERTTSHAYKTKYRDKYITSNIVLT